ncbi:hypothetical protein ES703_107701 [subsurface metagenome]
MKEKARVGYKSEIKGLRFEQRVGSHFSKKGWQIKFRKRISGGEIDIYGELEEFLSGKSFLLVECKDKDLVSKADVMRFMRKVTDFYKRLPGGLFGEKPSVKVVLAYTGKVDSDAKAVGASFKPKIEFKKF